ncbi:hypothetical protein BX616_006249 [Lobosporangium transversale]|nr:hypothetical protein BX616_006249 [Lobosporangium transversale]
MANERWDSDSKTLLTTVNANSNGDSGRCDSPNRNSGATGIMLMQTNRNWTNGNHEDHEQHDSIPNENENETLQKSEHTTTAVVTATPVRNMVLLTSSSSQTTSSSSPSPLLALSPFKRKRFMVDNSTQFSLDMSLKPFTSQQIAQARNNNPQHYARYHTHTHTYTQLTSNDNKNSTILSDHHPLATSRAPVPLVGSSPSSSLTLSSPSQSFAIASVSSVEFLSPSMSSISASVNAMMSTPRSYCSADNDGNSTGTVYGSGRRATTPHQQSHQSISAASSMMTTGSTATEVDTIQYHQQKSASSAYSWKATSSIAKCDSAHFQISNGKGLMAPSTSMDQQQFRLHHQPLSAAVPYVGTGGSFVQVPSTPMWLHSSALTTSQGSDSIASAIAASPQPPYSELHWPQTTLTATSPSSGGSTIEYTLLPSTSEQFVLSEIHSGVIMASPGPALSSSSLSEVRRSSLANTTTPTSTMATSFGHHRLSDFVRALFSQSLVSRLYARRPHFFSVGSQSTPVSSTLLSSVNSWTIIRVVNTCHLLYLIPVTSVSIARLVTIE